MSLKINKIIIFFALFTILIIIPTSFASEINETGELSSNNDVNNIFYVSLEGNDTNDGSYSNPLHSISRALTLSNAVNQSNIYINPGVYTEHDLDILSNVNITGLGNVTIDSQQKGRIFTVEDDLEVNFKNLNLINGEGIDDIYVLYSGYQNGAGAIYVKQATVTMDNLTFIENSATAYGGAIVWDGDNGIIKNSRFINNYANVYGGALDWQGDNAKIENCSFIYNQAENGGALFYEGYVLNLINCIFEENFANWGGAISIISTSQSDDNYLTGNSFIKNEAESYGGAIVLDNEMLVSCSSYTIISRNNFENNVAAYGGAISSYHANMDVINNIFVNHTASYGGVIASSGVLYLKNNTMKNSKATTIGNEIYNVGTFEGFLNITFMEGKTVEVTGQSIRLNASVSDDMGNLISGGSVKFTVNDTETLYSPSVLTEGFCYVAFAPRENGTYEISGNYANVGYKYSNVINGYIIVTNASADYFGPIYLSQYIGNDANVGSPASPVATFEVAFSLASRQGASNTIIIQPGKYDVARYDISSKSFTIIGEGNPILDAGDKFMFSFTGYANNYFNITGVTLANGYAASSTYAGNYAGGAIFFKGGHLYLKDVTFLNNTAEDYGGAIHVNKGFNLNTGAQYIGEAKIVNCTFINNQVIGNDGYDRNVGGAISTYGGIVIIVNSTFINNYARFGGALGIEQYHGGMTVINSTFINNEAVRSGGAIYFDTVTPFTAEIYNSTFDSNTALNGGAVYVGDSVVDNCIFLNNEANNGGALITYGDEVIINNKFINNTASVGGAMLINKNPSQVFTNILKIQLANNTIEDCHALTGNEIYLDSELLVSGLIISVLDNMTKYYSIGLANIYANVTDDMDNSITTTNFTFIINGNDYDATVNEGLAIVPYVISVLDNNLLVDATLLAGDESLIVKTGIIKLVTGEIIVDFNNASGCLNDNIQVTVYVIDEKGNPITGGFLNVTFNSATFNASIFNGIANVNLTLPNQLGIYPLTAKYANISLTRYVTVNQATPKINIEVSPSYVGLSEIINITLNSDVLGNVTIRVDNNTYTKTLENGFVSLKLFNLVNKTYIVDVYYSGSDKYTNASAYASFEVFKVNDYDMIVSTNQIVEGENLTVDVHLPKDTTGNVTIRLNNVNYTKTIVDGFTEFNIKNLKVGIYDLRAYYKGDEKYLNKTRNLSVIVSRVSDYEIHVNSTIAREGENTTIKVYLPNDTKGNITITVNNETYEVVIENGLAILNITCLKEGTYPFEVSYAGDAKYLKKTVNDTLTVDSPLNVKLIVEDVVKYYSGSQNLIIRFVDIQNNPLNGIRVNITINNKTYSRGVVNGTARMQLKLNSGEYDVIVSFNGNDKYDAVSTKAHVTIKQTINATDIVKIYRNATQFIANFVDGEGNPLVKNNVSFNINGVLYHRMTNANGTVRLNIYLNSGTYIITSINTVTGEFKANNVTVIGKIVENHDLTKYYRNTSQYIVKVLDDKGNSVGAGKNISFNINGVFYYRLTNNGGLARLNINLNPGDYIITAQYEGYMASNNIKVLSTLSAEDLDMRYMDGRQFEAKLVDGQGNPLNSHNIIFNINGVLYNRITDADGIARLNIRLMAGKYIITSSYNGLNIANTITIS